MNIKKFIPDKEFIIGVVLVLAAIVFIAGMFPANRMVQTVRSYLGLQARVVTASGTEGSTTAYA